MKKSLIPSLIMLSVSGVSMTKVDASESVAGWCEQEWLAQSALFVGKDMPDYNGLLDRWMQYRGKCQGTVSYEARLAFIYYFLNQNDKAKDSLRSVEHKASPYSYMVDLAKIWIEASELSVSKSSDMRRLREIESQLQKIVIQHPEHVESYGLLGGLESSLGHHEQAITTLEKGLALAKPAHSKAGIYQNLTISYAEVGRYQDAYDAAGNAINLRKAASDNQFFMYALAKANAGLGKFSDAQMDLKLIAAKKPEVKQDPEFLAAVDFVIKKIKQAQK